MYRVKVYKNKNTIAETYKANDWNVMGNILILHLPHGIRGFKDFGEFYVDDIESTLPKVPDLSDDAPEPEESEG